MALVRMPVVLTTELLFEDSDQVCPTCGDPTLHHYETFGETFSGFTETDVFRCMSCEEIVLVAYKQDLELLKPVLLDFFVEEK